MLALQSLGIWWDRSSEVEIEATVYNIFDPGAENAACKRPTVIGASQKMLG